MKLSQKNGIRSNHTVRWNGYNNSGSIRNKITIAHHSEPDVQRSYKLNSTIRCCQMCGGTRFSCKAIFNEPNQYGKGLYKPGKGLYKPGKNNKDSYMDEYDDYVSSLNDDNY